MRTPFLGLVLLLSMSFSILLSQESEPYVTSSKGFDIGINVTSVLSSFSGNGSSLDAEDLPIFFRFTQQKSAFRVGIGVKGTSNSFFDNVSFAERQTTQQSYFTKLGIEIHAPLDNKWQFYYGIDAVGSLLKADVTVFSNGFDSTIDQRVIGLGASPFLGIRLFIGERFYLSTESNLTYIYKLFDTTERFSDINGFPDERTTDSQASEFSISPPLQLYVNYKLK